MSIAVEALSKNYGSQKAIHQISFSIPSQRIIGFLGPNGAGKSTTMKIITGILAADQGKVYVAGIDTAQSPILAKQKIGYLPEHNPLYLDMYVRELLHFEANIHQLKNKKERIEEVILQTGLQLEAHKTIRQLSKGYRQRVGLAMAILHDPEVLILDEPTTGLDPNQILEIRQLIQQLGQEKTVLLSTHIMQEVTALCDEVIILHKGTIKDQFAISEMSERYPLKSLEDIFIQLTQA